MLRLGRIGEHVIADAAVVDDVVAQAELLVDDRGQRLDPVCIDLAELLDPAEDIVELGRQPSISSSLIAMRASLAMCRTCRSSLT